MLASLWRRDKEPSPRSDRKPNLAMYKDLLRPGIYEWNAHLLPAESLDMRCDAESDSIIVGYYIDDVWVAETQALTGRDLAQGSRVFVPLLRQRVTALVRRGREQFNSRRFRLVEAGSPSLKDKAAAKAVAFKRKGRYVRRHTQVADPVRLPALVVSSSIGPDFVA